MLTLDRQNGCEESLVSDNALAAVPVAGPNGSALMRNGRHGLRLLCFTVSFSLSYGWVMPLTPTLFQSITPTGLLGMYRNENVFESAADRRSFLQQILSIGTTTSFSTFLGISDAQASDNEEAPSIALTVMTLDTSGSFRSSPVLDNQTEMSATLSESAIQTEQKDLVDELKADESDQIVTEKKDTNALIQQLEQDERAVIKSEGSAIEEKTQQLVERLEKDEERTEAEIEQLIDKAEQLESDEEKVESMQMPTDVSPEETKEFITVLKERSAENKDLIETLKARSQKYYNTETNRFESMSKDDFLMRNKEVVAKENIAAQLFDRIKEGIVAAEEGLEADEKNLASKIEKEFPGLGDAMKNLSVRAKEEFLSDKAAVERIVEDEGLLELLKVREKATDSFLEKYESFMERLDGSLMDVLKSQ